MQNHPDKKRLHAALFQWWKDLENNKGVRATLRRSNGPPSLIRHAKQFVDLDNKLESDGINPDMLMPILGLLSHVKKETTEKIREHKIKMAQAMARPKNNSPVVSELRFQRILQAKTRDELYPLLLRAIKLLDGNINVSDLIDSVHFWGESVRKRWALDYYKILSQTKDQ